MDKLKEYGFTVNHASLDGAITNRQFCHLHFKNGRSTVEDEMFVASSPITSESVIMLQDIKHNLKKIRNGIQKSSIVEGKEKRKLKVDGKLILWSQF